MLVFNTKILCAASLWLLGTEAIKCYTPNGDDRNEQFGYGEGELYAPCTAGANHSMCCAWGSVRTAQGSADVCLGNGLCQNGDLTWRESCTDPTWQDPACLKLFVNGTGYGADPIVYDGDDPITDVTVTQCDNGSFCRGDSNRACCAQGQGVFLDAKGEQTNVDPRATSSTTSSPTSSTSSSTASSASSSSSAVDSNASQTSAAQASRSNSGGGLSTGAKAGIGAGVGGAALIGIIVGALWFVRKRKRNPPGELSAVPEQPHTQEIKPQYYGSELPVSGSGKDYQGPHGRAEMESPATTLMGKGSSQASSVPEMGQR